MRVVFVVCFFIFFIVFWLGLLWVSEVSWRNVVIVMVFLFVVGFDVCKGGYDSGGNLGGGK